MQRHASSGASVNLVVGFVSPNFGRDNKGCPSSSCGTSHKLSAFGRREFRTSNHCKQTNWTNPTRIPHQHAELLLWLLIRFIELSRSYDVVCTSLAGWFLHNHTSSTYGGILMSWRQLKLPLAFGQTYHVGKCVGNVIAFDAGNVLSSNEPEYQPALGHRHHISARSFVEGAQQ